MNRPPRRTRPSLFVALATLLLALAACGGGSSGGTGSPDVPVAPDAGGATDVASPAPDTAGPGVDIPLPQAFRRLLFLDQTGDNGLPCATECTKWVRAISSVPLGVRFESSSDGASGWQPAAGIAVQFEIRGETQAQAQLEVGDGTTGFLVTGANGEATVALRVLAVDLPAQFAVQVTARDLPEVTPLFFTIVIDKTDGPPLTVLPEYVGAQPVAGVVVRLFQQPADAAHPRGYIADGLRCTDLEPFVRAGDDVHMPPASIRSSEVAYPQSVVFHGANFVGLEADGEQMFTVLAIGKDRDGTDRVLGCDDRNALLHAGQSTNVPVTMLDLPPRLAGTYDVKSEFDLISALPPSVSGVVYDIIGFFESPTTELLELLCELGGDVAVLGDLCDALFTAGDPSQPPSFTGQIMVAILDAVIAGLAADTPWGGVLSGGAELGQILENLTFLSRVTFAVEPDAEGRVAASDVHEEWTSLRYRWTLGMTPACTADPDCGWNEFSFSAIALEVVEAAFGASWNTSELDGHEPYTLLTIDEHPVNIRYGALLDYLFRKVILPRLAGGEPPDGLPVVDEYEELLKVILAGRECLLDEASPDGDTCCHAFAQRLVDEGGEVAANVAENACEVLINFGAQYLENLLLGLDFETGQPGADNAFVIGTPAGTPCVTFDHDNDRKTDSLGKADAKCSWLTTLHLDINGGTEITIDADFVGTRQ